MIGSYLTNRSASCGVKAPAHLPAVAPPTAPDDLTACLPWTMHQATPPAFAERRAMCTEFPLAPQCGVVDPMDTSVGHIGERVSDIARESQGT